MNILLTSSGLSSDYIHCYVDTMIMTKGYKRVAIITTASPLKENYEWSIVSANQLKEINSVETVDFLDLEDPDAYAKISNYDVLFVNGGNTFRLLSSFNETHNKTAILDFINSGKFYIGVSAGSCVLGKDVNILKEIGMDSNHANIASTNGYNIFPYSIIPHFGEIYFEANQKNIDVFPLEDGQAIVLKSSKDYVVIG